jgi:hypothetical protein
MARGVGGHSPANMQKYLEISEGTKLPSGEAGPFADRSRQWSLRRGTRCPKQLPEENFGGPQDVMKAYGEERRSE